MATADRQPRSLITQAMRDWVGTESPPLVSPPIERSDIRRTAIAAYWPEAPPRLYWDIEYAKGTRWGGIIAPQDFNPFAWPIERQPGREVDGPRTAPGTRGMNGGQVETFGVPMRPGDVITSRTRLKDWNERTTRLGLTLFTETEMEWRNQRGELVKTRISTGIRY